MKGKSLIAKSLYDSEPEGKLWLKMTFIKPQTTKFAEIIFVSNFYVAKITHY